MEPLSELDGMTREEAAQGIAARLRFIATEDFHSVETWHDVAIVRDVAVELVHCPGGTHGEYHPAKRGATISGITINTAYPEAEQVRVFVHELAHHELNIWIPPRLDGCADLYCYSGDVEEIRHDIARRVEELVLGE